MYIVTGGAGFIGSALLRQLNSQGIDDILVVDNLESSEKWRNLRKCRYLDYVQRDKFIEKVRKNGLPENTWGIAHLGASSSTTERNADFLMDNNFHYSRDLCQAAIEKGIRFIHASSAATYGAAEHGFSDDPANLENLVPLNMYGYSKHLFDLWLRRKRFPPGCLSLKFFNVFGPNEYHKGAMQSVVPRLFQEIGERGQATLFASAREDCKDGEQKRDFIYVKDCARLLSLFLLEKREIDGVRNLGTGRATSFKNLAGAIFRAMGKPENIVYVPTPPHIAKAYQYYTCADMGWLATQGLEPAFTPLENAVNDYVRNYLSRPDPWL